MANTYSDRLKLRMPAIGDENWGDEVNQNVGILEAVVGSMGRGNRILDGVAPSIGTGLYVDNTEGNASVNGTKHAIAAASVLCSANQINYIYVDSSGALQASTSIPTGEFAIYAIADTGASTITRVGDLRVLEPKRHELQLASGAEINEFSSDDTLAGDSDAAVPTEQAVKAYVDGKLSTDGTLADESDTVAPTENAVKTYVDGRVDHEQMGFIRPIFRYKDADELYIGSGQVFVKPSAGAGKRFWWGTELTFVCGSTGSNSGSDALPISGAYYIYIDHSVADAISTRELTAAAFLGKTTAPTWDPARWGWYDGDDLCIFGIPTDGSGNIFLFIQNENVINYYTNGTTPANNYDIRDNFTPTADTDYTNYANIPDFSERAIIIKTAKACNDVYLKKPGGSDYTHLVYSVGGSLFPSWRLEIPTGAGGEFVLRAATAGTVFMGTVGYFLPKGM